MTLPRLRDNVAPSRRLREALDRLRAEAQVPSAFPPEVEAEARAVAAAWRAVTGEKGTKGTADLPGPMPTRDMRDIPFVTIDPATSRDLDQAVHLERTDTGYRVHYAIASLATFVAPGGTLDHEVWTRATTVYAPDYSTPLHPRAISEDAASLLPNVDRPACVWTFTLDSAGGMTTAHVVRAMVRSRAKLSYVAVQAALTGTSTLPAEVPTDLPALLQEIGTARQRVEAERGGISLAVPEQEIKKVNGGYRLVYRAPLPVEEWNAQISLLTGMAAAQLMLEAGVGILRTLPAADERDVARLRRTARALGLAWPADDDYPAFVRSLDASRPAEAAFLNVATALFRGGDYVACGEESPVKDVSAVTHAAIAAPYAHVTAPLRRLVDRYGLEVCLAHCAGEPVPAWVRTALPGLPTAMGEGRRRARTVANGAVAAMEALVLDSHVGENLPGVVIDHKRSSRNGNSCLVQIAEPAVILLAEGSAPLGETVQVHIAAVDVSVRKVTAQLVKVV